ncbi:NAD-dependent succinate-semialdehyde dehydrogenase [Hoeflea olei]|uniref:NAD-dependent succinate-semialdehyde dehydrogenase n=1 Tax=Hoeflea olei TaxID=1480615 RepID=A0A1C1YR99_9HYPH|nr:NAD-dependent succinate-semialdehyde dehydrogenase [Hoeflea olei]OCW56033.1 NAD-dependent succinate-semialdehyde dehydrogenase [Hoeflea olei]
METTYPDTQLFIDGTWRDARDGKVLDVRNPATGAVAGRVSHAGRADLDAALAACAKGFAAWRDTPALTRSSLMRQAAANLREMAEETARHLTIEQGKPLAEARLEVLAAAQTIEWLAKEARRSYGTLIPARGPGVTQMALKQPIGPVAAFTPWNFPINQVVRKLCAALAAGCSIIVKGPEETPAAPAALIRAFERTEIPAGVIGLVYGDPAEISDYLISSPVIRKVSFTGSTPVGKHLAALAGRHMKKTTMELGGHAPVIVCADADIADAARQFAASKYRNAGQVCISPTRFLVEEPAYDDFLGEFVAAARKIKVGDGLAEGTQMGPLANERRIPALEALLTDAVRHGATIATGGARIGNSGNFFEPTVVANAPVEARIMNEEPFGPVAIVNRVASLDEAIAEANRLPFGLASYAFARSARSIERLGAEIVAGMTTINHIGLGLPETPFGGVRDSGYGNEGGSEAIGDYQVTRFVTQKTLDPA